jgi:hypothetical protein
MNIGVMLGRLTWEAMSTASCCMLSGMSAFLITALRSDMARSQGSHQEMWPGKRSAAVLCSKQL